MKQWTILIISIFLLIIAGFWQINYLEKTSKYTLSDIEYVKNTAINGNFELSKEGIKNIKNTWNNIKLVWHIFIDSNEIDGVEETITKLQSYADEENKEEIIGNANELDRIINYIISKQQIKIGNIL